MKIKIRQIATIFLLATGIVFPAFANPGLIDSIITASGSIKTLSCFVYAENNANHRKSTIQYAFQFKRDGEKMKIEYLSPRNMKGVKIAIDGTYFYSYMPNMNRKIKKKIDVNSTKNPGKEMGIFFYFVKGNLKDRISGMDVSYIGKENVNLKGKNGNGTVRADHFSFKNGRERQEVWFDSETLVPVKVEIYNGKKLKLKMMVSDIKLNENLSDSIFSL